MAASDLAVRPSEEIRGISSWVRVDPPQAMRLSVPALILAAFLALAIAVLVGGGMAARRVDVVRTERDRGAQEELAGDLAVELRRLEVLYEAHLRRVLALRDKGASETLLASAGRNV